MAPRGGPRPPGQRPDCGMMIVMLASVQINGQKLLTLFGKFAQGAAVAALAFVLAFGNASPALAARSGGRVGGSSFSAARSYSSSGSSARSYSSGSSSRSSSSGGSSFSGSSSRSSGSRPSTSYASKSSSPAVAFSWGLVPFGGYGYGYGFGGGLQQGYGGGGGLNIGSLLLFGVVAYFAVTALSSYFNNSSSGSDDYVGERVTVAKLQVGLLGSARTLQNQLDRIASRADTNTPSGLHYILQETVLQLVRNPEYVQYGATVISNQRDLDRGEAKFNEMSVEERSKFKEETLVNVSGRSRRQRYSKGAGGSGVPEYIVVTILVAASGKLELPKITSQDQLVKALNRLASIREDQVMAVEVLWTPEDEDDTYSRDEMLLDYPSLNNV
ncbi:hypothetical protein WJX75_006440 [Coccomyxa subellipsoidea]|uniref:DUF1517 domain-containing protein n=1 Tax=Coccomyxa subellipsoidea TaxID=248742 RepID=A0ABR2YQ56_9CHLO